MQVLSSGVFKANQYFAFDYKGTLHLFDFADNKLKHIGSSAHLAKFGLVRKMLQNKTFMNLGGQLFKIQDQYISVESLTEWFADKMEEKSLGG